MLAGTGPPYSTPLVDWVAEPESVASLVFSKAVVALGSGVGIPRSHGAVARRIDDAPDRGCDYLVRVTRARPLPLPPPGWTSVGDATRPRDREEVTQIFRRTATPNAPR